MIVGFGCICWSWVLIYICIFVYLFLMEDYLGELIDAFVVVYNSEAGLRDVVVYGGDDVSRERFCSGLSDNGIVVFGVREFNREPVDDRYSIGLGYYLKRGCLPKIADVRFISGEPEEVRSLGVRISVL